MTIRTLLVDDETIALRGLHQRLLRETDIAIVGQCEDGASAIAAINELQPDLVFLDIQMPGLGGFDVIAAIGLERMPPVIFVTAFDQFALRAFDVHAIDYVLKPIASERFQQALGWARETLRQPAAGRLKERIAAALEDLGLAPRRWARRLAIKSAGRVVLVDVGDIDRIEAAGNYAEICIGAKRHLLRETLASLEGRLDPAGFARISRAAIVNIERVRELQPLFSGDFLVLLKDGSQVAGSRRYRETLDRLLS